MKVPREVQIKNFGFNVTGSFKGLKGVVHFDPNNLAASSFDVSIDANTINTGIDMRDEHLRSDSYFDVKNYPQIHFVSTRVTTSNRAGTFFVFGHLTIKQTTKEISFPFTYQTEAEGPLFKGEFKLNRRDFSIGGSGTISNELVVKLEVVTKNNQKIILFCRY
jgi:polyisoprenoid-binding protein YceI